MYIYHLKMKYLLLIILTICAVSVKSQNLCISTNTNIFTGPGPQSVITSDFNNDGFSDFAVGNYSSGSVSIHLGNGNGTFTSAGNISVTDPNDLCSADFNNDG